MFQGVLLHNFFPLEFDEIDLACMNEQSFTNCLNCHFVCECEKEFCVELTHFYTPVWFYIFPTCLNCYRKAKEVYLGKKTSSDDCGAQTNKQGMLLENTLNSSWLQRSLILYQASGHTLSSQVHTVKTNTHTQNLSSTLFCMYVCLSV